MEHRGNPYLRRHGYHQTGDRLPTWCSEARPLRIRLIQAIKSLPDFRSAGLFVTGQRSKRLTLPSPWPAETGPFLVSLRGTGDYLSQYRDGCRWIKPTDFLHDDAAAIKKPAGFHQQAFFETRQRPTFPLPHSSSIIGLGGLNFRVRYGNGCGPSGNATGNFE